MKLLDFLNILAFLTLFTGVVSLTDWLLRRFSSHPDNVKTHPLLHYCRDFFPVLCIVFVLRCFVFQPYHVPSESLEPTLMPGDYLVVTQYDYGLKTPFWENVFLPVNHPKRGQIAVFRSTTNPTGLTLIKRVVGVPGDRISYINKVLFINGHKMSQKEMGPAEEVFHDGRRQTVRQYEEDLFGVKHAIFRNPVHPARDFHDLLVPPGHYFMMGDNRDDSDDSRGWGFAPEESFIGRAKFIFLNVGISPLHFNWRRIGNRL